MERFSIILLVLCALAILAGSTVAGSSATSTETSKGRANDTQDTENHRADRLKSKNMQNNSKYSSNEEHVKNAATFEEHPMKDLSYSKGSNGSSTVEFSSSYIKNTQHSEHIGDRESDASRSDRKEGPAVGLSSYDILLDPTLISTRLTRRAEKSDADYSNPASVGNAFGDIERGSIDLSQRSSSHGGDLGVAEDRYRPQYPYWYRGQFTNQRYQANDRREPYRNYLRYPVFPGR